MRRGLEDDGSEARHARAAPIDGNGEGNENGVLMALSDTRTTLHNSAEARIDVLRCAVGCVGCCV